jgi:ubiquinone/menaquinone biosynthesis C-methylase UbiE
MDFAEAALSRCRRRLEALNITNVDTIQGDISRTPLPPNSVDLILCMSVFHYLDCGQARAALLEFRRLLKPGGKLVLHVKNSSSLYIFTLSLAKRLLRAFGKNTTLEYFRPFSWYVSELKETGFSLAAYNSFNLLILDRMPRSVVMFLQRFEFKHRNRFPLSSALVRRYGADLKLRATKLSL